MAWLACPNRRLCVSHVPQIRHHCFIYCSSLGNDWKVAFHVRVQPVHCDWKCSCHPEGNCRNWESRQWMLRMNWYPLSNLGHCDFCFLSVTRKVKIFLIINILLLFRGSPRNGLTISSIPGPFCLKQRMEWKKPKMVPKFYVKSKGWRNEGIRENLALQNELVLNQKENN